MILIVVGTLRVPSLMKKGDKNFTHPSLLSHFKLDKCIHICYNKTKDIKWIALSIYNRVFTISISSKMAIFDTTSKKYVETNAQDFVDLCFGFEATDITVLEIITPEQPTVQMHQADSLIKTVYNGKAILVHFEFQVNDSFDPEMSLRMAGYIMRAIETYRLPVYSNVIYLRPDAGKNDPGRYEQNIKHHNILIEYKVFRLIDLDGQKILDAKLIGLIPFTPLMGHQPDIDADEWFRRCVRVAHSIDVPNKPEYLASLSILGNLVCDSQTIMDIILEETMEHAPIVELMAPHAHKLGKAEGLEEGKAEGLEEGKAEGLEEGRINEKRTGVLKIVHYRFADKSDTVLNEITAINDLDHLDELFDQVLTAETFEDIDFAKNGK